jgi:hypothetical protein
MSWQNPWERRDSGVRALAVAGGVAMIVTLMLGLAVGVIWIVAQGPAVASPSRARVASTPTPRALTFTHPTPTPEAVAEPTATEGIMLTAAQPAAENPMATATPELLLAQNGSAATADKAIMRAESRADFAALAAGSWSSSGDMLDIDGANATSEPWLKVASVPSPDFAIEAEMRVTMVLDSVCDQSFGVVGGSPGASQVYGGGILYPCDGKGDLARLTNVTNWEDGYNADAALSENQFDPGEEWHTYRLELRGNRLRLIIDGVGIVTGKLETPIDPGATDAEAGIWSQGVGLEVRRIAVFPLPAG